MGEGKDMDIADPARELAVARPDDPALTHLAVVGDTYTVLLSGGPPPHRHDFEECFRVLEGSIEVQVGDLPPVLLAEGETANIPANAPPAFRNAAEAQARLLCTVVPSGLERYFDGMEFVSLPERGDIINNQGRS
jgi:quercetin dioxygenase-like cupin family protein